MKLQKCYMGCTFLDRKTNQNLVNKCDDLIFSKDFAWNSAGRASSISTAKAFITWDSGFKNTDARSDLAVLSSILLSFVPFVSKCSLPRGGGVKDHEFLTVLLTNPQKKKEKIYPKTTNLLIDKRGHPQVYEKLYSQTWQ